MFLAMKAVGLGMVLGVFAIASIHFVQGDRLTAIALVLGCVGVCALVRQYFKY